MPAEWLSQSSDLWGRASAGLSSAVHSMAQPARAHRLRQGLLALFALWGIAALAQLLWLLVPGAEPTLPAEVEIINPVQSQSERQAAGTEAVNIERMRGWHLFGVADAVPEGEAAAAAEQEQALASDLDGIEKGARETRLDLKLRGVVASSEDGLGHAIIEHKKKQQVYAVEDKLPVSGRVFLAKVMPRQVVLDNGGKYELLTLFEETELDRQVGDAPVRPATRSRRKPEPVSAKAQPRAIDRRKDEEATRLARNYRDQLYQNPQSLADVVQISAVREEGQLRGYRIGPGKQSAQFEQLGFKRGDLVVGVNGISLDDPSNTMRLYQAMRSAGEATFELQRGGEQISLVVNLEATPAQGPEQ